MRFLALLPLLYSGVDAGKTESVICWLDPGPNGIPVELNFNRGKKYASTVTIAMNIRPKVLQLDKNLLQWCGEGNRFRLIDRKKPDGNSFSVCRKPKAMRPQQQHLPN